MSGKREMTDGRRMAKNHDAMVAKAHSKKDITSIAFDAEIDRMISRGVVVDRTQLAKAAGVHPSTFYRAVSAKHCDPATGERLTIQQRYLDAVYTISHSQASAVTTPLQGEAAALRVQIANLTAQTLRQQEQIREMEKTISRHLGQKYTAGLDPSVQRRLDESDRLHLRLEEAMTEIADLRGMLAGKDADLEEVRRLNRKHTIKVENLRRKLKNFGVEA